jgi:hypothetical protein
VIYQSDEDMFNQQRDGLEAKVIVDREGKHYQLLNSGWRKDEYQFFLCLQQ